MVVEAIENTVSRFNPHPSSWLGMLFKKIFPSFSCIKATCFASVKRKKAEQQGPKYIK